ncbi:hypothetical protein GCM10010519_07070 [Streptomyces lactacystinicus]
MLSEHRERVGERVSAAGIADDSGHGDNGRGDQEYESENDDHDVLPNGSTSYDYSQLPD